MSRVGVLSRKELQIIASDPWFLVIMSVMPLAIMPLIAPLIGTSMEVRGLEPSGGLVAVPGQTAIFSFFVASSAAFSIYREHGWRTWDRLRASAASPTELLAGRAIPWTIIHVIYQVALFTVGGVIVGSPVWRAPVATLVLMVTFGASLVCFALLLTAVFSSIQQVNAIMNIGAMVFGGLGGALVPYDSLPGWAQRIGPVSPTYWVMRGHTASLVERHSLTDPEVAVPVGVLIGFVVLFGTMARWRFNVEDRKEFFD